MPTRCRIDSGPCARALVVGVDGGGTHTRAVLADEQGQVLGRGEAGAANPMQHGIASARQEILLAIRRAYEVSHLSQRPLAAACLGIAGIKRSGERQAWQEWAAESICARSLLLNDAEIIFAAGTPENWGIVLIAGTGSICWGKTPDGREETSGGWGYLIGDEGSGFALVSQALRAAVCSTDGRGAPTALLETFLKHWKLTEPRELVPQVHQVESPNQLARLAPLVVQAAVEGDAVASALVAHAGQDLAAMVCAVAGRLGLSSTPLALAGGLLLGSDQVQRELARSLASSPYRFKPIQLVPEPALGAVQLALQLV